MPTPLPTRDLIGVELLSSGGPYRGIGSPEEGDFYTDDDLRQFARDTTAVLDEIRPYNKIGHNSAQVLARRSGFYAEDDQPQTGRWTNFRVAGGKLLGDAKAVPSKFADLIESGAFSRRSVEIKPYESQSGKGRYTNVIRAVAWLGAKAPAIKTLDDVVALYGDDESDDDDLRTIDYEDATPTAVLDLNVDLSTITTEDVRDAEESSDTRSEMPETTNENTAALELSDEQRDQLAEALGIEGEVTADVLIARAAQMRTLAEADGGDEDDSDDSDEDVEEPAVNNGSRMLSDSEFYELVNRANAGARAEARLIARDRDDLLVEAMSDGRLDPAQREEFARLYEENPDFTTRMIEALPVNEDRARIYGSDDEREITGEDEALYRAFSEHSGVDPVGDES
ncbi:MAG: hypothetical protein H0U46_08050 [Actinobacteria bacterium]|nr:hypothetical protein [Actinomycetota bacterium]